LSVPGPRVTFGVPGTCSRVEAFNGVEIAGGHPKMLHLKNTVAVLALVAMTATLPPVAMGQDQPAAEPAEDLESLVDSLSGEAADEVAPLPEEELLTDAELDELVAPIALYPDALLAQVLVASTYPLQIVKADRIIAESEGLSDEELSATLSEQDFDPSVLVLLSGFPTVVERMAADLDWTERLGIAMLQQDEDVLAAVQRMRADARDMGYLSSNEAQVVEEENGEIYIAPADPEVVYVPSYDPDVVYSAPAPAEPYYVAPAQSASPFSWQNLATTGVIAFGSALLVNELWGDDDDDDDDWDDYWRRPRPVDWDDREFYPRPYWNRERAEAARSWAWERDRYWRREDERWQRELARDRREAARDRAEALGYLGRDPARARAAGPWREIERSERRERQAIRARQERVEERREADRREQLREERQRARRQEQRQQDREQAERQELREERQRAQRQEQRRQDAAVEERQRAQRQEERRQEAAAEERRQARQRVERQQEAREKAAAEERRAARQRAERQEEQRRQASAEERRQREAAERAAAREQRAKAERAAEQSRDRDAAERRAQSQRAEEARRQQQERASSQQRQGGDRARGNERREQAREDDGGRRQRCREGERDCR
jgi:hypothetical protein